MFRHALRIWVMHSLAFVAGLVVSGVVAVGLWFVVPTEGGNALFVGSALAVSIVSVGTGYAVYLALIAALLDLLPGWGFYLGGPLVVLAIMTLVFCAVYFRILAAGAGSLLGYGLMYGIGGVALHLSQRGDAPQAETGGGA